MVLNSIVGIIALVCAVWVIFDVWSNQKKKSTVEKVVWTVFAIIFSIITAIVYYFVGRK